MPTIDFRTQEFLRVTYGILLLAFLAHSMPHWRRFYLSERWGGYGKSELAVNIFHNPAVFPVIASIWFACAISLVVGFHAVAASLINFLVCRYFFVFMRWKGILRGSGAPGYIAYWLGGAVFLLEYTLHRPAYLHSLTLLVLQADFALIIFSAGLYKYMSGYFRGNGIDFGLSNPMWCYWPRFFKQRSPNSFVLMNHLAWSSQILCAGLMLLPPTRIWGGVLEIATYILIATQIRLGFLAEFMCLGGILFFGGGTWGSRILSKIIAADMVTSVSIPASWNTPDVFLAVLLSAYLVLLPIAHAGLFYNFYARKRLPSLLQKALERYTNFFGILIWRVFSVDHLNFFVRIYRAPSEESTRRELLSQFDNPRCLRFWHVAENIVITSLFTTPKYYPHNPEIFRERLLRYARTIPCSQYQRLIFEYVSIQKAAAGYDYVSVIEYHVHASASSITELKLDSSFNPAGAHPSSQVHECLAPGTYAPLEPTV